MPRVRDEISRLSEELARDPDSPAMSRLGEVLRREGQLDLARQVVERGLHRRPYDVAAHDVLARISLDRGEYERAGDEWDMVRRLSPDHAGAAKGMAFIAFHQGDVASAERLLGEAAALAPGDPEIEAALAHVRVAGPGATPAGASAAVRPGAPVAPAVLVASAEGLVLEGSYRASDGTERSEDICAHLGGLAFEASRALDALQLGRWRSMHVETSEATIGLAPAPDHAMVLLAAPRAMPLGLVRQTLEGERARVSAALTSSR
jgi:predicted regulator of Ras-like GTPase activity (Roadblock/LC7/MglB family)